MIRYLSLAVLLSACSSAATGEVDIGPEPEATAAVTQELPAPAPTGTSSAPAEPQGGPAPSAPVCVNGVCVPWVPDGYRFNGVCMMPLTQPSCACVADDSGQACRGECFTGPDGVSVQPVYCTATDGKHWTWPHGDLSPSGQRVD